MFLAHVVVGRGYKTITDISHLSQPPNGYDSVLGEPGGSLNHDELVVYKNEAALPAYFIIYRP